jgi:segregation and condensation protein A
LSIHVHLERFEGPLGLLLYLIRQEEMDIFDININQITKQYFEYIKTMRKLDLEVAGEFVAMAATLLHIKSRMLLPQYDGDPNGEPIEDPRKELVQKLVEYQKIQELSKQLYARPLLGRDVFTRGERENFTAVEEGELIVEENPLFSLIAAYRHSVKAMKKTIHRVLGELQSISGRIMEMKERLLVGQRVGFNTFITVTEGPALSSQILVTFLSLLELAKMNFVSLFQAETFSEIHVETKKEIDRDVLSAVEDYQNVESAQKADDIINKANQAQLQLSEAEMTFDEDEVEAAAPAAWAEEAATDEEILAEETRLQLDGPNEEKEIL